MKYALKPVPGIAEVEVPMGMVPKLRPRVRIKNGHIPRWSAWKNEGVEFEIAIIKAKLAVGSSDRCAFLYRWMECILNTEDIFDSDCWKISVVDSTWLP